MKRLTIAFGLALILTLGSASRADAQVIYNYGVNPYSGTVRSNYSVVTPFSAQSSSGYYNPYMGYGGQRYTYQNALGAGYTTGYGVNPYYGPYNYSNVRVPVTIWGTTYPSWYMFR
jgi:hypothetical protein